MKGIETKLDFVRQAFASVTGPRISFCAPARCAAAEVDGAELLDTLVRITRFRCDWEDEMLGRSLGVLALLVDGRRFGVGAGFDSAFHLDRPARIGAFDFGGGLVRQYKGNVS